MATILERGYYDYRHKSCKSLIRFELSELITESIADYQGDREYFRVLVCPACNEDIRFPTYGEPC